jgi:hypothetical protein
MPQRGDESLVDRSVEHQGFCCIESLCGLRGAQIMSEKNVYESIRDDVGGLAKNAIVLVFVVGVAILYIVVKILAAIAQAVAYLVFFAALTVLLTIPIYIGLEQFYYRRFARTTNPPARYRRRIARIEKLLETVADSRVCLERHIQELTASEPEQVTNELATIRAYEHRLRAKMRDAATVEANWLTERLNVTDLKRSALLRRVSATGGTQLREHLLRLHDEALSYRMQLGQLNADYNAEPVMGGKQPCVVYIGRLLNAPLHFVHREPFAPRASALLSWPLIFFVLVGGLLAFLIAGLGFESIAYR